MPSHRSPLLPQSAPKWGWQISFGLMFSVAFLAAGAVWVVPLEVFQQWAFERAKPDQFSQFEAIGSSEFLVWTGRIVFPLLLIAIAFAWRHLSTSVEFLFDFSHGVSEATRQGGTFDRLRTWTYRGLVGAWAFLFLFHAAQGVTQRAHDWPYFRFNSGQVVLPNISDSNRAVIRYLQAATPPDAKILVASDQKLFFLSYYLRPRTLFHRMHPESEHVIPLAEQQRKLMAYRLDELTQEDLQQIRHDYTLEYFEHPDLVKRDEVMDDPAWVSFVRNLQHNPSLVPPYLVRLRKVEGPQK